MSRTITLASAALAGAAVLLAPAVPAVAEAPKTSLRLTLTYPGGDTSRARSVTLRCDPAGGSHPAAARACADLGGTDGRFVHDPDGRVCTAQYSPVVAEARGHWRDRPTSFVAQYGNECDLRSRTGAIFTF